MAGAVQGSGQGRAGQGTEELTHNNQIEISEVSFPSGPARLSGSLFMPKGTPRAGVVINSATGVPHGYYRHFAEWLARERDCAVLTYDYRDFGASLAGPLRGSRTTMADWVLTDMPAARDEMRRQVPGAPLWVIGHSVGAMAMPSQQGIEDVERMICVAAGLVWHRDHPWPYQALARAFWFGHVPLLVRVLGYLPGRLVGFGADLPAPVYWQWRRWCTHADSYRPEIGTILPSPDWKRSGAPVDLFSFADDATSPEISVRKLAAMYDGAEVRTRVVHPGDLGLDAIGHLSAFARRNMALWPELVG